MSEIRLGRHLMKQLSAGRIAEINSTATLWPKMNPGYCNLRGLILTLKRHFKHGNTLKINKNIKYIVLVDLQNKWPCQKMPIYTVELKKRKVGNFPIAAMVKIK